MRQLAVAVIVTVGNSGDNSGELVSIYPTHLSKVDSVPDGVKNRNQHNNEYLTTTMRGVNAERRNKHRTVCYSCTLLNG